MATSFETAERKLLAQTVADYTTREIVPYLDEWEDGGEFPRALYRTTAAAGLLGVGYDEDIGGSGGDIADMTIVTEALLGHGASGGLFAGLFSHGIALPHIVDAAQRRRAADDHAGATELTELWIRPVLAGDKIAALGVTEPDGGSDVARLRTRAVKVDNGWSLSGAKTYITSGVRADVMVVAARADGPGAQGVALFAVDTSLPGFSVTRSLSKMGWQCSDTAELALVDCVVPDSARLTTAPGDGFASLATHFAAERLSLATLAYSTALRCIELTVDWCRNRETFGRPLMTRQVVRHDLVEMVRQTRVAQTFTRDCVAAPRNSRDYLLNAVLAKNTAVAACDFVVDKAVQLHGGLGYMRGTEVERHYRDAKILGIGGGATEVMTDLAAKLLDF